MLINGPNLNLLGTREQNIYGKDTLKKIENLCEQTAKTLNLNIICKQSNHEGKIVDYIQEAHKQADSIIINPAAYSHTSIAIADALKNFGKPIIEVHISNIHTREEFRHYSFVSQTATGVIAGLGTYGYIAALHALANIAYTT